MQDGLLVEGSLPHSLTCLFTVLYSAGSLKVTAY